MEFEEKMVRKMKRMIMILLLVLLLCGCQAAPEETTPTTEPPKTVGICLPGRSAVWKPHANKLAAALEAEGIRVRFEFGAEDVLLQQSQVQNLLHMPVDLLVLGAYDPLTLSEYLTDIDTPVLAYDRALRLTDDIDGCVMADYFDAGQQMVAYALEQYPEKEQITLELFMGQPQDPNAYRFYQGVMEALQPLLDSGKVVILSERVAFEDVCLSKGELEDARDQCFDYLAREYENTFPDVLICGNDAMAEGCIQALEGMAFSPSESWPVVTGLGGEEDFLWLVEDGYLTVTAKVDEDAMVEACVRWILALLEGQTPEAQQLDTGTDMIPAELLKLHLITR